MQTTACECRYVCDYCVGYVDWLRTLDTPIHLLPMSKNSKPYKDVLASSITKTGGSEHTVKDVHSSMPSSHEESQSQALLNSYDVTIQTVFYNQNTQSQTTHQQTTAPTLNTKSTSTLGNGRPEMEEKSYSQMIKGKLPKAINATNSSTCLPDYLLFHYNSFMANLPSCLGIKNYPKFPRRSFNICTKSNSHTHMPSHFLISRRSKTNFNIRFTFFVIIKFRHRKVFNLNMNIYLAF